MREAYRTYLTPPEFEFYDLEKDPFEFVNLVEDKASLEIFEEFKGRLHERLKNVGDPFAKVENVEAWISQESEGRKIDYRKEKSWRWDYLSQFHDR